MRYIRRTFFWICWPGLYLYFWHSQRSRVLIRNNNDTLLVKGFWKSWFADERFGLPGGGIARKEQPVDAALRELYEELKIKVKPEDLHFIGDDYVREYGIGYKASFFVYNMPTRANVEAQKPEIAEIAWLDLRGEMPQKQLKPEVLQALELLAKQ